MCPGFPPRRLRCLGAVGDAGRRRMRARRCLAPTVALGHSCQRARSWLYVPRISSAQAPVPRGGGRREASPARARQCLAPTVALGHSCQRARSWLGQTNREACLGAVGDSGARARRCLAPAVALGHSCQRARSWFYVPRISSAQTPVPRGGGRRGASPVRARQCLAPTSGYSASLAATRRNLSVLPRILASNTKSVRSSSGRRKVSCAATMSSPAASMTVRA